jgi:CHASE1-domain containing sensor protein
MNKILLAVLAMLLFAAAYAGQDEAQGQKFQEVKNRLLDRLDQRIDALQKAKDCVEKAQDAQALRDCRPDRGGADRG